MLTAEGGRGGGSWAAERRRALSIRLPAHTHTGGDRPSACNTHTLLLAMAASRPPGAVIAELRDGLLRKTSRGPPPARQVLETFRDTELAHVVPDGGGFDVCLAILQHYKPGKKEGEENKLIRQAYDYLRRLQGAGDVLPVQRAALYKVLAANDDVDEALPPRRVAALQLHAELVASAPEEPEGASLHAPLRAALTALAAGIRDNSRRAGEPSLKSKEKAALATAVFPAPGLLHAVAALGDGLAACARRAAAGDDATPASVAAFRGACSVVVPLLEHALNAAIPAALVGGRAMPHAADALAAAAAALQAVAGAALWAGRAASLAADTPEALPAATTTQLECLGISVHTVLSGVIEAAPALVQPHAAAGAVTPRDAEVACSLLAAASCINKVAVEMGLREQMGGLSLLKLQPPAFSGAGSSGVDGVWTTAADPAGEAAAALLASRPLLPSQRLLQQCLFDPRPRVRLVAAAELCTLGLPCLLSPLATEGESSSSGGLAPPPPSCMSALVDAIVGSLEAGSRAGDPSITASACRAALALGRAFGAWEGATLQRAASSLAAEAGNDVLALRLLHTYCEVSRLMCLVCDSLLRLSCLPMPRHANGCPSSAWGRALALQRQALAAATPLSALALAGADASRLPATALEAVSIVGSVLLDGWQPGSSSSLGSESASLASPVARGDALVGGVSETALGGIDGIVSLPTAASSSGPSVTSPRSAASSTATSSAALGRGGRALVASGWDGGLAWLAASVGAGAAGVLAAAFAHDAAAAAFSPAAFPGTCLDLLEELRIRLRAASGPAAPSALGAFSSLPPALLPLQWLRATLPLAWVLHACGVHPTRLLHGFDQCRLAGDPSTATEAALADTASELLTISLRITSGWPTGRAAAYLANSAGGLAGAGKAAGATFACGVVDALLDIGVSPSDRQPGWPAPPGAPEPLAAPPALPFPLPVAVALRYLSSTWTEGEGPRLPPAVLRPLKAHGMRSAAAMDSLGGAGGEEDAAATPRSGWALAAGTSDAQWQARALHLVTQLCFD